MPVKLSNTNPHLGELAAKVIVPVKVEVELKLVTVRTPVSMAEIPLDPVLVTGEPLQTPASLTGAHW